MRAAILTEIGKPLTVAILERPHDPGVGQVLVKMQYAAICGAQLNEIDGAKGPDKYLPHLLGHEGVGTVLEIGPGVTTKAVGDRVICHWRPSEGIAAQAPLYHWGAIAVNAGPMACFATECIVSENRLTLLPDGIDPKVAPLFGCALTTAYGVVTNDVQVKPGDTVLVIGCGGVGAAIVQMAALCSAEVTAIDPVGSKQRLARTLGAGHAYGSTHDIIGEWDAVIDTTGRSECIEYAIDVTAPHGTTVLVGVPGCHDPITLHTLPLHHGQRLTGSEGGSCVPHRDIPKMARLVEMGQLHLNGLVTDEFPLDSINDAIALVRSGEAGRVLLRMDS